METNEFEIISLEEINGLDKINETLNKCLKQKSSIFVVCPPTRKLWAIPETFSAYLRLKKKGSEADIFNPTKLPALQKSIDGILLHINNDVVFRPVEFHPENVLIELNESDIATLNSNKKVSVINPKCFFYLSENKLYQKVEYIEEVIYLNPNKSQLKKEKKPNLDKFSLFLSRQGLKPWETGSAGGSDNSPITVKISDCFVSQLLISALQFNIENIPQTSPFFVPEHCLHLSKLCELATIGQNLHANENPNPPTNMKKYLQKQLNLTEKTAGTAAFLISPTPKGNMKSEFENKIQFPHLIEVFNFFYENGNRKDKIKDPALNQKIINHFDEEYGYSNEKCRGAAHFLRATP